MIVIIGHDYRARPVTIAGINARGRSCASTRAGEINSFERFHLRANTDRERKRENVIARHRRVIKNHGRGAEYSRETEIHGKFNPVIRAGKRACAVLTRGAVIAIWRSSQTDRTKWGEN